MTAPLFWHSGGHVMCAEGPLDLPLARRLGGVCAEEAAKATCDDTPRAAAFRAAGEALSAALTMAEAWRRAAGWDNPDAADRLAGRPY
jgi:hypothetical protein